MKLRQFVVRALSVGAVGVAAVATAVGPASAVPAPAQGDWVFGASIPVVGSNAYCNGVVDAVVETDPAAPGRTTVTLVSRGMQGVGDEWARNPVCPNTFVIAWTKGALPFDRQEVRLAAGPAPGASVRTDINTGSGPVYFSIGTTTDTPAAYPVAGLFLVP